MKTRSRRWEAPTPAALTRIHSASNPRWAKSPRTMAKPPLEIRGGTFSKNTSDGPISSMRSRMGGQSQRSSSVPAPLPAALHGWHGKPAVTQSTTPRHGRPSKVPRSPSQTGHGATRFCAMRSARRPTSKASLSTMQTLRAVGTASRSPSSRPPMPVQMETTLRAGSTFTGSRDPRRPDSRPRPDPRH